MLLAGQHMHIEYDRQEYNAHNPTLFNCSESTVYKLVHVTHVYGFLVTVKSLASFSLLQTLNRAGTHTHTHTHTHT